MQTTKIEHKLVLNRENIFFFKLIDDLIRKFKTIKRKLTNIVESSTS